MEHFFARAAIEGDERRQRMQDNARRGYKRLRLHPERKEPVAICGYGPSLRESWEGLKNYQNVCTTSGAHDFIIERGLHPNWHVEYDPRPHKAAFLTKPQPGTEYCIASTCNDNLFALLPRDQVYLWHALGPDSDEDIAAITAVEPDGMMLCGGSSAGARAIVVCYVLGFRSFAFFGMDCGYSKDGSTWAGYHTGLPHQKVEVECNGRTFITSPAMINAANEIWDCLFNKLHTENPLSFGDNLFTERLKLPREIADNPRAWWSPIGWELQEVDDETGQPIEGEETKDTPFITERFRRQNRLLHLSNLNYGLLGKKHVDRVRALMVQYDTNSVLDYGCGKRTLELALGQVISNYDPAIVACEQLPDPADIVVCTDVLEHIEPNRLDAVIEHIRSLTRKCTLLGVATRPATKTYPDGRNTHLTVQPQDWWCEKLRPYFVLTIIEGNSDGFIATAIPRAA